MLTIPLCLPILYIKSHALILQSYENAIIVQMKADEDTKVQRVYTMCLTPKSMIIPLHHRPLPGWKGKVVSQRKWRDASEGCPCDMTE